MNLAAWVTVCEGLSNYAAIGSAYCFARPVLVRHSLETTAGLLGEADAAAGEDVVRLTRELEMATRQRLAGTIGAAQRWNRGGLILLLLSAALLITATVCNGLTSH